MNPNYLANNLLKIICDYKNYLYQENIYFINSKHYLLNKCQVNISQFDKLYFQVSKCSKCNLHKNRNKFVFGHGNIKTPLIIIGEAPGYDEDIKGLPFVGKAGKLLTKMLNSIQIDREKTYICNIIKCRPQDNRTPDKIQIDTCYQYLKEQIKLINPKFIVTLGNVASKTILNKEIPISKLRGNYYNINNIIVIPMYHPSALLRNNALKNPTWHDLKMLKNLLINSKLFNNLSLN